MRAKSILIAALLATAATAQVIPPLTPFERTLDLLVVDSSFDGIWRLADRNQDGDYLDNNEIGVFYSDAVGTVALTNPTCIAVGHTGRVFIGDSTVDVILALRDDDADGDANDASEHQVFFDSNTNASGIVMASVQGLTVDLIGRVFVVVSDAGSSTGDVILQLQDLNGDGDANDVGEASVYCAIPNATGALGDSIPTDVRVGPDLNLYFTDVGATGVVQKGVYRASDLNFDGDASDPGEVTLFWSPPGNVSAFYWGLAIDRNFRFWVTDHGNEQVFTAFDADGSGSIDPSEEQLFYQSTSATYWDVLVQDNGRVLLCEDQTPDRVMALQDLNGDGDAQDPGELTNVYEDGLVPENLRPRGAAFMPAPRLDAPASAPIGQSFTLTTRAQKPGDFAFLALGGPLPGSPTSLPPYGWIEIDTVGAQTFGLGLANGQATVDFVINVPSNPSLVGSVGFQVVSGDRFRPFLSNGAVVSITL